MSLLIAVMTAIAIWHFTIWLPDNWWGGILGAFFISILGAILSSFVLNGFGVSGIADSNLLSLAEALPGIAVALLASWVIGKKKLKA